MVLVAAAGCNQAVSRPVSVSWCGAGVAVHVTNKRYEQANGMRACFHGLLLLV